MHVSVVHVRTAGLDLAAEAKRTALAVISWGTDRAVLESVHVRVTDALVVDAMSGVAKLGIDCALGWPEEFVAFVTQNAAGDVVQAPEGGAQWRKTLAFRETDRNVHARTGRWPLSVSTDRLGLTAMRCAGLLHRLSQAALPVDRSGIDGVVVEVYPGATLRLWRWDIGGYRADAMVRRALIARMAVDAPWLRLGPHAELVEKSTDAFDAVIAALTARAAQLGCVGEIPATARERARREGWIALPSVPLGQLLAGAND